MIKEKGRGIPKKILGGDLEIDDNKNNLQDEDLSIDSDEIPQQILSIIGEGGADLKYSVSVFKTNPATNEREKIKTCAVEEFYPDDIVKMYGGGKYEYHIRENGKIRKRLTTTYAIPIIKESEVKQITMEDIQKIMKPQNQDSENMFKYMMSMQQQNTANLMAMLTAILPVLKSDTPKGSNIEETLKLINAMGVRNPNSDIEKFITVFEKGMNLSSKLQGDGSDDSLNLEGILSAIIKNKGGDILSAILSRGRGQDPAEILKQAELSTGKENIPQDPLLIPAKPDNKQQVLEFFKAQVKKILYNINTGVSFNDMADYFYNGITLFDEINDIMLDVFLTDVSFIYNDIPEFAQDDKVKTYVKSMLESLKQLLYNTDNEENKKVEAKDESSNKETTSK